MSPLAVDRIQFIFKFNPQLWLKAGPLMILIPLLQQLQQAQIFYSTCCDNGAAAYVRSMLGTFVSLFGTSLII